MKELTLSNNSSKKTKIYLMIAHNKIQIITELLKSTIKFKNISSSKERDQVKMIIQHLQIIFNQKKVFIKHNIIKQAWKMIKKKLDIVSGTIYLMIVIKYTIQTSILKIIWKNLEKILKNPLKFLKVILLKSNHSILIP